MLKILQFVNCVFGRHVTGLLEIVTDSDGLLLCSQSQALVKQFIKKSTIHPPSFYAQKRASKTPPTG